MQRKQKTYNFFHLVSATFMMFALLWLTISIPFVLDSQKKLAQENNIANAASQGNEEEAGLFGNTTEEKAPSSSSFSEEYLHDNNSTDHFFSIASQYYECENADAYTAFHGEIHVPPPNVA